MRGARGEGGGNERERRMRRETEGRMEARGSLAPEDSQGGTLEGKIKIQVNFTDQYSTILIEPQQCNLIIFNK